MFFKNLDFISPDITLFHKNDDKHASIISGILTIITYIIIIILAILNLVKLFNRTTFTTYFYTRYSDEINTMTFSDKEFFHYVEFYPHEIDDSIVNIIGIESAPNLYFSGQTFGYPSLDQVNEYIYEKCTIEDMKNHENLISNKEKFLKSYCLQKMYDYKTKKILDKKDSNFIFPKIDNVNKSVYSIIIKKCSNDENTIGYKRNCVSDEEFNSANLETYSAYFHSVDRYIDVGNYKNPIIDFNFYKEIGLDISDNFVINKINYHNVLLNSHEGYLFESVKKTNTLVFENNEISYNVGVIRSEGILCSAEYWNSGKISIYEREYQTLLDVFSNIGGIMEIIMKIFSFINIFFNSFSIYNDSINIFFENKKNYNIIKNEDTNTQEKINLNVNIRTKRNNSKKTAINNLVFDEQSRSTLRSKKNETGKCEKNNNACTKNDESNNSKDLEEKNFYEINFFKYIYLLITKCCSNNSKKYFKYCDLREEIVSEDFLYKVYFKTIYQNNINNEEINVKNT